MLHFMFEMAQQKSNPNFAKINRIIPVKKIEKV